MILKFLLNTRMMWITFMKIIDECNPSKKCKKIILFDDMVAVMLSNQEALANSNGIIYQSQKYKHFCRFNYAILLCCSKKSLD